MDVEVVVSATWNLSGGEPVVAEQDVLVPANDIARASFSEPATLDQIERNQLAAGEACSIGGTFK